MATEWETMIAGGLYDASDAELALARRRARGLLRLYNGSSVEEDDERARLLRELLGAVGEGVKIEPPFACDYGRNIRMGDRVYFNVNAVILDPAPVTIGDDVFFGPGVQIYTATHPLDHLERRSGLESARPIEVGSDVWVGGGAILRPGVRVGSRSVVGAGSVVTRDVPEGVVAAGNPCRVIRAL